MPECDRLLAVLQHGDSFFPSGAASFSWGLETLCGDGLIGSTDDVHEFLEGQLLCRWASYDRPAVIAAHRAANDPDRIAEIDEVLEAQTLAAELRNGSRRIGAALLGVHAALKTPGAADYQDRVRQRQAFGHAPAMQGFLWAAAGIPEDSASALSAHVQCVGLIGAALRLGIIGHLDAQMILKQVHPTINEILAAPAPAFGNLAAFTPESEIAVMRHEVSESRLFAN